MKLKTVTQLPPNFCCIQVGFDLFLGKHPTNSFCVQQPDQSYIIIDPAVADKHEFDRYKNQLKTKQCAFIFISHAHFDHYRHAHWLAQSLNIPILMNKKTHEKICKRRGDDYFEVAKITYVKDNETIGYYQNSEIRTILLPGHCESSLGLYSANREWLFLADLVESKNTVMVENLNDYYESCEKVIALQPHIILPSHGSPLKTTKRIQDVLRYRKSREKDIFDLINRGYNLSEIVKKLYTNLSPQLKELATVTINAYIQYYEKLSAEK